MLRYQDQESGLFFQLTALGRHQAIIWRRPPRPWQRIPFIKGYEMGIFNRQTVHRADLIMMALETEKQSSETDASPGGTCAGTGLGPADRPEQDGSVSYYLGEAVVSDEQKGRGCLYAGLQPVEVRRRVYRIRR